MTDLFFLTAPLLIRFPDRNRGVMVERLPHTGVLVYIRPFLRYRMPLAEGIRFVPGRLRGDGPWKVGDAVITLLGCHGTDPEQAAKYAEWQTNREQLAADYPAGNALLQFARAAGHFT